MRNPTGDANFTNQSLLSRKALTENNYHHWTKVADFMHTCVYVCVRNPHNSCIVFFLSGILGSQSYKASLPACEAIAGGRRLPKMCNAAAAAIEQEPQEWVCPPLAKSITINLSKSQAFPLVLLPVKCESAPTDTRPFQWLVSFLHFE